MGVTPSKGTPTHAVDRQQFYQPIRDRSVQDEITFANTLFWASTPSGLPSLTRGATMHTALCLFVSGAVEGGQQRDDG
jgi:hypothetical protein